MKKPKSVNLALQGGGAHGAFTWGVLDRLLEDGSLTFEAISGTSAGAMNAVVLADGWVQGGQDGAREALERFWRAVAKAATASPLQRNPFNRLFGDWSLDNSPGYLFFDVVSRLASPYELNPLNLNPLRDLLEAQVDFERVESCNRIKLFLTATNVHTGRARVFKTDEITADVVLASACLPFLFQAVEIEGVPYWDGGYLGNPALWPFFNACSSEDVLLVQINPLEREETPKTARDILNRLNEITFNASLMKELRAIEFVSRLIDSGQLDSADYKQIRLHRIHDDEAMTQLSASSKLNAEWDFLRYLKDLGRQATDRWLEETLGDIGQRSSVDINQLFR
ncbi:MAG: patatin-like phospholipase family protein [Wenzhouxiangella sp.]|jgi:NTE family protein|nr:patatin-like phospholipase family protein [Wenzhouxiangella sp.]